MKSKIFIAAILFLSVSTIFGQTQKILKRTNDTLVDINIETVTSTEITARFTPRTNCAKYYIYVDTVGGIENYIGYIFFGDTIKTIEDVIVKFGQVPYTEEEIKTWGDSYVEPNKDYVVYACAFDASNNRYPAIADSVHSLAQGGEGLSIIDIEVTEIGDASVRLLARPNDQTAVYRDGLMTKELFDEIGTDSAGVLIWENNILYPLYTDDNHVWLNLEPGTEYKAIAVGQNINGEFGEIAVLDFKTTGGSNSYENIAENSKINIYPQPNSGFFFLENIKSNEDSQIYIYDINGVCVHKEIINASKKSINVSHLSEGYYLLRNNNQSVRFIIKK